MRREKTSAGFRSVLWLLVAAGTVVLGLQAGDLYALTWLVDGSTTGAGGAELTLRTVAATGNTDAQCSPTSTFLPVCTPSRPSVVATDGPNDTPGSTPTDDPASGAISVADVVPNFALIGDGGDLGRRTREIARRLMPLLFGTLIKDVLYVDMASLLEELDAGEVRWGPGRAYALIVSDDRVVKVLPGSERAEANLRPLQLAGIPALVNGRLEVPVRSLDAILGAATDYSDPRKVFTVKLGTRRVSILAREDIYQLEVSRSERRLQVYAFGEPVKSYGLCVGRGNNTPVGHFHIERRAVWPPWTTYEGKYIPGGSRSNPLGARWLGTTARGHERGWAIGIHGTNQPSSIGRRISGGCMRTFNENAIELYNNIPIGTSVWIHEEPISRPGGEAT
ncbi:MAG TPA: hypothetical protein DGT21_14055 [Armatimonadetes bacterium]|nr:hypothetical protein [Armatimonadota bacterium]